MLPNWLYGKSKSKLANILGGGGGTPADYNQVKAQVNQNTEDIELLNDALDDKAALTQLSNPNILHNPWFTVNQRGITSITVSNEFIADRWRVYTTLATFEATRNSNGFIVIDNSSGDQNVILYQKRTTTYLTSLLGNKLTASVLLSDGTIYSGTITYDGSSKDYVDNEYICLYMPSAVTNQILGLTVKPGASITIKALKLEVGEISTLAMDPRPEYAIELAKCQRYFQNIVNTDSSNNRLIGIAYAVSTTSARILLTLPDHMRTNSPTITSSGSFLIQPITGGSGIDVTSIASLGLMETYINIKADVASGLTAGTTYFFQMKPDAAINLSAEL